MRKLKLFCSVTVVLVCMFSFSLSASAVDYDFNLSSFPISDDITKSNHHAFVNGFYKSIDGNIYYFEYVTSDTSSTKNHFGNQMFPCWGVVDKGDYSAVLPVPSYWLAPLGGCKNDNYAFDTWVAIYDTNGNKVYPNASPNIYMFGSWSSFHIGYCNFDDTKVSLYPKMQLFDADSYIILTDNSYNVEYFTPDNPNLAMAVKYGGNNIISYPIVSSSFNVNTSSIDDDIYINGEKIYSGTGGGGSSLPTFITGSGTGSDGNTTYNYTYEFDMSPFVTPNRQVPDSYDSSGIDDYNSEQAATDEAIDSFKGDHDFSDVFSDFDITDFNDAMSFWEDRFDDIVGTNPIFLVVIVSMLTLGIIVVILNRKVGT